MSIVINIALHFIFPPFSIGLHLLNYLSLNSSRSVTWYVIHVIWVWLQGVHFSIPELQEMCFWRVKSLNENHFAWTTFIQCKQYFMSIKLQMTEIHSTDFKTLLWYMKALKMFIRKIWSNNTQNWWYTAMIHMVKTSPLLWKWCVSPCRCKFCYGKHCQPINIP